MKGLKEVELGWVVRVKDKEMRPVALAVVATKQVVVPKGGELVFK